MSFTVKLTEKAPSSIISSYVGILTQNRRPGAAITSNSRIIEQVEKEAARASVQRRGMRRPELFGLQTNLPEPNVQNRTKGKHHRRENLQRGIDAAYLQDPLQYGDHRV